MPTISVVIPAYNVEKYLDKCMNSVLNQSFTDFEVLLIDDGAKDSTVQLCDKYAEKDTRVKTYHKKNGGLSDARNYGLERISGKYVTFIDSDDYIDNNYLKYMYDLIVKENAQICMVQGQLLLEEEEPHKFPINIEKCVSTEEAIRMMLLRREATHTSWGNYMMFLCGKIFVFLKAKIMKIMQLHIMCFRRQQELLIVMPNYIIIYNAWGQ